MSIEKINQYLARDFGYFNGTEPIYRVVWSEEEVEKRLSKHTDEGFELINEVVMEKPKYKQHIHNKYILERCLEIPSFVKTDLVDKYSYEPVHVFAIGKGDPYEFDTFYGACKWLIGEIHKAAGRAHYGSNYKSPEEKATPQELLHIKAEEVRKMQEFLFPDLNDIFHAEEQVGVPTNYQANGTSLIKE